MATETSEDAVAFAMVMPVASMRPGQSETSPPMPAKPAKPVSRSSGVRRNIRRGVMCTSGSPGGARRAHHRKRDRRHRHRESEQQVAAFKPLGEARSRKGACETRDRERDGARPFHAPAAPVTDQD